MGTARKVKCNTCNRQWDHYEGFGFQGAFYYCNKCGKEKSINIFDDPKTEKGIVDEYGPCKCGGTFRIDNDIILCPKCHIPAVDVGDVNILWD